MKTYICEECGRDTGITDFCPECEAKAFVANEKKEPEWKNLPDAEGWWWKHFSGDDSPHIVRITASELRVLDQCGDDFRGKDVVIHYLGPIPAPSLP